MVSTFFVILHPLFEKEITFQLLKAEEKNIFFFILRK